MPEHSWGYWPADSVVADQGDDQYSTATSALHTPFELSPLNKYGTLIFQHRHRLIEIRLTWRGIQPGRIQIAMA